MVTESVFRRREELENEYKKLNGQLVELITEEEALQKCATNGAREKRMILLKPDFVKTEDKAMLAVYPERYTEEDLDVGVKPKEEDLDMSEIDSLDVEEADADMDWLNALA